MPVQAGSHAYAAAGSHGPGILHAVGDVRRIVDDTSRFVDYKCRVVYDVHRVVDVRDAEIARGEWNVCSDAEFDELVSVHDADDVCPA